MGNRKGGYSHSALEALEALAPAIVQAFSRKRAEQALARTKDKLENTLKSITSGYYALDAQWRFVDANYAAEVHFGKPRDRLIGRNVWNRASMNALHGLHVQLVVDFDGGNYALGRWAMRHIGLEGLLSLRLLVPGQLQRVMDEDTRDFQYTVYILDVPGHIRTKALFGCGDLLFRQQRSESAHHSPAHGTDNMIQRGGVLLFRFNAVKAFDAPVNTIIDGLVKAFNERFAGRPFFSCNKNLRLMNHFTHCVLLQVCTWASLL